MIFRSFFLAGAALCTNALLVVPEVEGGVDYTPIPETEVSKLDPVQALGAKQQQITLRCTECPFQDIDDGKVNWVDGSETSLSLNLDVDGNSLLVNGRQIFPPPPKSIDIVQRRESDGKESEPIPIGQMVEVMPRATSTKEPIIELSSIRFTILDLDFHPVPLDTVVIDVIQDHTGELFIVKTDIEETTSDRLSWRQCRGKPKCLRKLFISRVRALVASTKARMLSMGSRITGHKGCHGPPMNPSDGEHPPFEKGSHHGHHGPPHGPPHGPHHHSAFGRTFSRLVRFVLIPAALGVLAGLTASALGMLIGQLVVFVWLRYRRPAIERSPVQLEEGTDVEKEALVADELPPKYEEGREI